MHAPGKGLSQSALPYRCSVPTWLKLTSDDVKEQIYKLAKKGLTPSQIVQAGGPSANAGRTALMSRCRKQSCSSGSGWSEVRGVEPRRWEPIEKAGKSRSQEILEIRKYQVS
ncbi:hypothetical protein Celaphus_00002134 [Cervus elaphus hippelaphus]|uniref:Small ribosomal subunit protein uS15 N-terminal domain-containing protein n=1 Tax=Cervus elaphus hippelaphus TaxID=46360 RepID=A0A212CF44_CEREH|nr:hypothetical protein Celaphus_00002134 [Cervus elaphus hippelaphus]